MDCCNEGKGHMNYKLGAAFIVVFAAGAGVGALIMKKEMEKRYEYEEFEYEDNISCSTDVDLPVRYDEDEESEVSEVAADSFRVPRDSLVRSTLGSNQYEEAKKNYNIFNKRDLDILDKGTDEEEEPTPKVEEIDRSKPYIITDIEWNEEHNEFDKITLCFYRDGIIADENEEILDDISNTIGQEAYNLLVDNGNTVWVRNESLGADYEIVIMKLKYGDMIEPPPRRRKKYENREFEED